MKISLPILAASLFAGTAVAPAAIIYMETSPAPSSNDIDNTPQTFTLTSGASEVIGNYGENGPTLPNGNKDSDDAFTAIVPGGSTLTVTAFRDWDVVDVTAGSPSRLQILDASFNTIHTSSTTTGFTAGTAFGGTLPGGTSYSFILDQADPGLVNDWSLQLDVAPIPEPSAVLMIATAAIGTALRRRRTV